MVTLAYIIIASPIVAIIFFIFYKTILLFKEKSNYRKEIHHSYHSNQVKMDTVQSTKTEEPQIQIENDDKEINAVICAAVSYYLKYN